MPRTPRSGPWRRSRVKRIAVASLAFALLSSGCASPAVLPDPTIPHRVAEEAEIEVWCRHPDGTFARCRVRVTEGWWVASPQVVE